MQAKNNCMVLSDWCIGRVFIKYYCWYYKYCIFPQVHAVHECGHCELKKIDLNCKFMEYKIKTVWFVFCCSLMSTALNKMTSETESALSYFNRCACIVSTCHFVHHENLENTVKGIYKSGVQIKQFYFLQLQ